jgi:hypothetical protein
LGALAGMASALFIAVAWAAPHFPRLADRSPGAIPVDVELVIAVDISFSMDPEEQALQREGYIQALTSREFLRALREGANGKIAVTYFEWAGQYDQQILMPWRLIDGPEAADAVVGKHYIPTSYSPLTDFPFNQQWVTDFRAKFGFTPEDTSAGAYLGAQCVIEALKLTNGDTDSTKLRDALLAVSFDSPFGPVTFDPATRVRHMDMNICQIVKEGDEYLWNPIQTYKDIPPLGF